MLSYMDSLFLEEKMCQTAAIRTGLGFSDIFISIKKNLTEMPLDFRNFIFQNDVSHFKEKILSI